MTARASHPKLAARARLLPATAAGCALLVGCGAPGRLPRLGARDRQAPATSAAAPGPVAIELQPVGLSSAPTVSYATTQDATTLNGVVRPAGTTVYVLDPQGGRTVLNPGADGAFAWRAHLRPGANVFTFTAARLGSASRTGRVPVDWHGPSADAMHSAILADPAKYLPPASAGLNRRLPPLGGLPSIATGTIPVKFQLNTIQASPPPPAGGPGTWLGGFELTEHYPALEAWFVGAPVDAPGLVGQHRIDWLYSAHGLSMEGDGVGLDGRQYHVADLGSGGWLTAGGLGTAQFGPGSAPFWRTGGFWRSSSNLLTFPLAAGGWSAGTGVRYVPPPGITFAAGTVAPARLSA